MEGDTSAPSSSTALTNFLTDALQRRRSTHGAEQQSSEEKVFPVDVDVMSLLNCCPEMAAVLQNNPLQFMQVLHAELRSIAMEKKEPQLSTGSEARSRLRIRPTHVPPCLLARTDITFSRYGHGTFCSVIGTIARMSAKRVVAAVLTLKCPACGAVVDFPTDPFHRGAPVRARCDNKRCKGMDMQQLNQTWVDYVECRLQQRRCREEPGHLPRTILVTLEDELTEACSIGQLVEVCGFVKPRWKSLFPKAVPQIELVLLALNVTPVSLLDGMNAGSGLHPSAYTNRQTTEVFHAETFRGSFDSNLEQLRGALVASVCPQLCGCYFARLGLLLAAVGGVPCDKSARSHVRSNIHVLLVGDPSTGKTQLLQFAAALAPRSAFAVGMGSTAAGLTVAATREFGEWVLEPGALVLSDGGACVIDELRTVSAGDRTALHEAMEQQTISVAKAGIVTRLRTQCSVIAACNPPFRRRNRNNLDLGLGLPLLSRFDLIFLMWDEPNEEKDRSIASHIIGCASHSTEPPLSLEHLKAYIAYSHQHYNHRQDPRLEEAAVDLLARYYGALRHRGHSTLLAEEPPVTVRLLESLVRITQAHAKLLLRESCEAEDAAVAVLLMERTAHGLKLPVVPQEAPPTDGSEVANSKTSLDSIFFDTSEAGCQQQRDVLTRVVELVQKMRLPDDEDYAAPEGDGMDDSETASSKQQLPVGEKRPREEAREGKSQCKFDPEQLEVTSVVEYSPALTRVDHHEDAEEAASLLASISTRSQKVARNLVPEPSQQKDPSLSPVFLTLSRRLAQVRSKEEEAVTTTPTGQQQGGAHSDPSLDGPPTTAIMKDRNEPSGTSQRSPEHPLFMPDPSQRQRANPAPPSAAPPSATLPNPAVKPKARSALDILSALRYDPNKVLQ